MRIAFISSTKRWGGVKTWYLQVAEGLEKLGHSALIYARQEVFVKEAQKRISHAALTDFGFDFSPLAIARFYDEFRRQAVDLVIINVGRELSTAAVAARMLGIPVIQRIGLPGDIANKFKYRALHRLVNPFFFCPCQYIARGFLRNLPHVDPARCKVILTGKELGPEPQGCSPVRKLVISSQLSPEKGHDVLLRALAPLAAKGLPFELHVLGTGRIEPQLRQLAHDLGLDERVVWHGFVTDVQAHVAAYDIFVLPSLVEGLPNTLLEAMAAGLLPLTRLVGGVDEALTAPLMPWALPYEADEAQWQERLEQALQLDDKALLALKREAQTACREKFLLGHQVKAIEAYLEQEILGR